MNRLLKLLTLNLAAATLLTGCQTNVSDSPDLTTDLQTSSSKGKMVKVQRNPSENAGEFFSSSFKKNGKYVLPLRSIVNTKNRTHKADPRSWSTQYKTDELNFWAPGDFNNDGTMDYFLSFAQWDLTADKVRGAYVSKGWLIADEPGYAVVQGDPETGYANPDLYQAGPKNRKYNFTGSNITEKFIQSGDLGPLVTHQIGPMQPVVTDFNGDGVDDVYLAAAIRNKNRNMAYHNYFLSQPDGTHLESSPSHIKGEYVRNGRYASFSHRIDVGDLDNDGDMDIVHTRTSGIGTSGGEIICMFNDGKGKLTSRRCGDQWANNIKLGDFNGDGYTDMLAFAGHTLECNEYFEIDRRSQYNQGKTRPIPRLLLGNGSNKWTWKRSIEFNNGSYGYQQHRTDVKIPNCQVPEAVVFDIDNDGDQDVVANVVGRLYVGGYITVFENDGSGNFAIKETHIGRLPREEMINTDTWEDFEAGHGMQAYCYSMFTIDIDDDGNLDVICDTNFSHPIDGTVWKNNGDGYFKRFGKWNLEPYVDVF